MTSKQKVVLLFLLCAGIIGAASIVFIQIREREAPLIFSEKLMLNSLWRAYKQEYLEPGTWRTLDKSRGNITTSEGQSYTMLRAVWEDDKETFDRSWQWTKDNLQREEDHLFSWLFGKRADGSYGIITETGGQNTATDGDTDIALSLLFAYARWLDPKYLQDAKPIISDIWEKEVVTIQEKPFLVSNDTEKDKLEPTIVVNPSYFAPYAYRIFSIVDQEHDWMALVNSAYDVLEQSMQSPLNSQTSSSLPPDWILIDRQTGNILSPSTSQLTTHYSFDAMRIPWRIALDWEWFQDQKAKDILTKLVFLNQQWEQNGFLATSYTHDGKIVSPYETPAFYGANIGYFLVQKPEQAKIIYERKLKTLYNPDSETWKGTLSYYDDNWAWFGIALYHKALPNIFSSIWQDNLSLNQTTQQNP
ncbi:MAG: hypothetical protein HYW95_00455 [Candidatus Wildermuthbacteria bacterium]|nr:hypothetical protein [Candidatus Wildermuthbacteria bacterium]